MKKKRENKRVPSYTLADESFTIVRSYEEAVAFVLKNGVPEFISFDHDLGADKNGWPLPTGYDFAKWLVNSDLEGDIKLPENFSLKSIRKTVVGAKNIEMLLIVI